MAMRVFKSVIFLTLLQLGFWVSAEPVVVVNARSAVPKLSRDEVINIFLGRYRQLPTGETALPIDQPEGSALRSEFYRKLVNKEPNEINAYWARLIFSGKTAPPKEALSPAEVVSSLLAHPGAIAYLERSQLDARFKVVLEFAP
jgi:ABC-type phosphate transport system substrate-binding protein